MITNLVELSRNIEVEFKDKEARARWKQWNHDFANSKLARFTTEWTKCMQYVINGGENLTAKIINDAYSSAITNKEVCVFVLDSAKEIIINCWKYGNEFKELTS